MQQACFLCTVRLLDRRYCIFCPEIARAALLEVGSRGGLSSLLFTGMTVAVGIYPNNYFRKLFSFVYFFSDLYYFKHSAGFPSSYSSYQKVSMSRWCSHSTVVVLHTLHRGSDFPFYICSSMYIISNIAHVYLLLIIIPRWSLCPDSFRIVRRWCYKPCTEVKETLYSFHI